jgi:hypothetical protein
MIRAGKKSKANKKNNAELKRIFEGLQITFCERCGNKFGLTFAHSLKRRFIQTDEQMKEVAVLCVPCHQFVERQPDMTAIIQSIISRRQDLSYQAA